jgi:hypothetical protein
MLEKLRKIYKEQLLLFLSKYYKSNRDEKGGTCSKSVGNERSIKILLQRPQLKI